MFKATFDIVAEPAGADELQNSHLLMEIGEKTFSYVFYLKNQQQFRGFRQYSLDFIPGKSAIDSLRDILTGDELLQPTFRESYIVYNYADTSLVPAKHFHIELNKPVTELVYGNAHKGLLLSEKVAAWDLYTVYRVPRDIHSLLQKKFAAGKYWHYYSLLLADIKKEEVAAGSIIKIVVAPDQLVVAVFKEGQLQLIQTYAYQTPEDVSYCLLAICRRFTISQEEVVLKMAGLLDEQSNLYQELFKYFLHLQWEELPASVELEDSFLQFPRHYFSPILKMALCV